MAVTLDLAPAEVERMAEAMPELLDAMRTARANRWTTETELLAGIYELTHQNGRLLAVIAGIRRDEIPAPVRVPRPGSAETKPRPASGAQLRQWVTNRRGGTT